MGLNEYTNFLPHKKSIFYINPEVCGGSRTQMKIYIFHLGIPSKKIAQKATMKHSHLPPPPPSLNGAREIGTSKIVHLPPPPL